MDKYAKELEKAIFNWYYGGENAAPEPMFNAIVDGLENDMQMLVPFDVPEQMTEMFGNLIQFLLRKIFQLALNIFLCNKKGIISFLYLQAKKKQIKAQAHQLLINPLVAYLTP